MSTSTTQPGQFVGRTAELADLDRMLARAEGGRGGLALVVGEPGIGKTALLEAAVAARGVDVLWARAREGAGTPPLWLWDQVVRAGRLRGWTDVTVEPRLAVTALTGTGYERFRRFDELSSLLAAWARSHPFVLVFDDLQWADAESAAMLDFLAPDLADMPLSVLATARPGELATAPRADLVLELRGLGTSELHQLLSGFVGAGVNDELVKAVQRHTGGSPFFVGEVARLLRSSGHATDPAYWRGVVPEGVRSVLMRRLARLPQPSHDALSAAAVLGAEIDPTLLAAVLDIDRLDALDRLDPGVAARLLIALDDGRFAFAHALVHDAVLTELNAGTRRRLHGRAAEVLEATAGSRAAAAIAVHRLAQGDHGAGTLWARRAAEAAYASAMYADAASWFARAIETSPDPEPLLQVRLADALSRSGRVGEANAVYLEAARLSRAAGDVDTLAKAALGLGTVGGNFEVRLLEPAQLALLEEALARMDPGDSVVRALLLARLSVASTLNLDHEQRARHASDAVAMARRLGDDGALAYALSAWCDAHAGPRDLDARLAAAAELLAAARRSGDPELELLGHRFLIVANMEMGNIRQATLEVEAFARLADTLRQPQFCWYARLAEAMLRLLHGDVDAAERLGLEASRLGHAAHSGNAEMLTDGALLPMIRRARGDQEFYRTIDDVNRAYPEAARGIDIVPLFAIGHGIEPAAVRRSLEWLGFEAMGPDDGLYLQFLSLSGEGAAFVGDETLMAFVEERLAPYAERMVLDGTAAVCYGPAAITLARIARARGDEAAADRYVAQASEILARIDAPLLLAEVTAQGDATVRPEPTGGAHAALVREGDVWFVAYGDESARLRHTKGLADLAVLVSRPGSEVHVFDLVAAAEGRSADEGVASGDLGPALDATARAAYERRIRELTERIEDAEDRGDDDAAARYDDERATLLHTLAQALGLSGRPRPQGSDVERARKAVGMRIRDAIDRVERELPALGRHLRHSVRTGTMCSYTPEHPVAWRCQS